MSPRTVRVIPILRIFPVAKAREFYLDSLGWRLGWEHRFAEAVQLSMQVSCDGNRIHLCEPKANDSGAP
jgi:ribosomal-protein-alanine N-acetyltransferase